MRTSSVWLLIPLLAACAASAPRWEKSGANETAVAEDLQQCRVQVRMAPDQSIAASPTPQTSGTPLIDRGQERDAQEEQRIHTCMQGKGYALKR